MKNAWPIILVTVVTVVLGYFIFQAVKNADNAPVAPVAVEPVAPVVEEPAAEVVPPAAEVVKPAPKVTSVANEATVSIAPVLLSGTTPPDTESITVNGYKLTQYEAGAETWSYIAKPAFNNLKVGENIYKIEATSKTGEVSSTELTIYFQPTVVK